MKHPHFFLCHLFFPDAQLLPCLTYMLCECANDTRAKNYLHTFVTAMKKHTTLDSNLRVHVYLPKSLTCLLVNFDVRI